MNKLIAILFLLVEAIWRDLVVALRTALHPWEVLDAEMREQGLCGWPA